MTKHVEIEMSPRDRFMKLAKIELAKHEHRDLQARREKRVERAQQVQLNLDSNLEAGRDRDVWASVLSDGPDR